MMIKPDGDRFVRGVQASGIDGVVQGATGSWSVREGFPGVPLADVRASRSGANPYVLCPESLWVDYAIDEARRHMPGHVHRMSRMVAPFARGVVRATGWNQHVQINAWGLSTQLVVEEDASGVLALAETLRADGVGTVALRSVCEALSPTLWRAPGAWSVPTRQVWLWSEPPAKRKRKDFWADRALLKDPAWVWKPSTAWDDGDAQAARALYEDLYRTKYTPLNPSYTAQGLRLYADCGLPFWLLLDPDGVPVGMLGMMRVGGWMTTPFFGFDTKRPACDALYRRLSAWACLQAEEAGCGLHMSAGAARFKELRGATPHLETTLFWSQKAACKTWARSCVDFAARRAAPMVMRGRF